MRLLIPVIVLMLNFAYAHASDFCIELVRRAVYDKYISTSDISNYGEMQKQVCKEYEQYKSKEEGARGNVSVFGGMHKGGGSWSKQQVEFLGETFCGSEASQNKALQNTQIISETINPGMVHVLSQCADADKSGIKARSQFLDDGETMTLEVYYAPPLGRWSPQTFTDKPAIPEGLKCTGPLTSVKANTELSTESVGMQCSRGSKISFMEHGRRFEHRGGSVTVFTSAGMVNASMPKQPAPQHIVQCDENTPCTGKILACLSSSDRPTEVPPGLWLLGPNAPNFDSAEAKTTEILFGDWKNPQCGLEGKGWHAKIGSCGTGQGDRWQRCVAVRVQTSQP